MTLQPFAVAPVLGLLVPAPLAGFALQNATPTIATWTAPNDGQNHRFAIIATQTVSSLETGGIVSVTFTAPDGTASTHTLYPGGSAAGETNPSTGFTRVCKAGTAVSVVQSSALTVGAAVVWAEIWGS